MLSLKSVVYCTFKSHLSLFQMHLKSSESSCEKCYCIWQPRFYNINKDFHRFKGVNVFFSNWKYVPHRCHSLGSPVADPDKDLTGSSLFWKWSQENTWREWRSETEKGRKPIKSCYKWVSAQATGFLPAGSPRERIVPTDRQGHRNINLPTPHPSLIEVGIQGFFLILHMTPPCSSSWKKALQQRVADKQWTL